MWEIIRGIQKEYDCVVITPPDGEYYTRYQEAHIPVYAVSVRSLNPFVIFFISRIIKKEKPDIVHTHGKGAGIYGRASAWLLGIPCIHTMHGVHVQEHLRFVRFFYCFLEKRLARITKKIVAVSEGEQKESMRFGISSNKLCIIHNGIDFEQYCADSMVKEQTRKTLGIPNYAILIIGVGRNVFQKNFQEFVDIIASVKVHTPNIAAILVGDGNEREDIQTLVKKNDLCDTIQMLGTREDVPELLAASDLYLSTSRWEGMPLSVLEAMATGLPIVVSRVTGNNDLIENNENGMVYSLGNVKEASEKIMLLYKNKELRMRLGNKARADAIQKYNIGRMVAAHRELYNSIL